MRILIAALLLVGTSTTAHAEAPRGPDPRIRHCTLVAQAYNMWALDFRRLLERNSSDRGGRVASGLLTDMNFALVSAGEFVHTNIQFIQRANVWGGEPSVEACRAVTVSARAQIEQYARRLLSDIDPTDRGSRESLLQEFRMELRETTRRGQSF